MTLPVTAPAALPATSVQKGNKWDAQVLLPANNDQGDPIPWGTFSASVLPPLPDGSSIGATTTVATDGSITIDLALSKEQIQAITVPWVHWYIAEDTVQAGNNFIESRIDITEQQ